MDIDQIRNHGPSRRAFLTRMTAAGLGAAAVALLAPAAEAARSPKRAAAETAVAFPGIGGDSANAIVLNYALTLEILEADLYRQALNKASGRGLDEPLASDSRRYRQAVRNGGFDNEDQAFAAFLYLTQFAYVEAAHRDFLSAAIQGAGDTPVNRNAGGYRFPGGIANSLRGLMEQLIPLEETGVRAYLGALPFIRDLPTAQAAGTIFSTEARHSAAINYILGVDVGPVRMPGDQAVVPGQPSENTFEYFLPPATVISAVGVYFA